MHLLLEGVCKSLHKHFKRIFLRSDGTANAPAEQGGGNATGVADEPDMRREQDDLPPIRVDANGMPIIEDEYDEEGPLVPVRGRGRGCGGRGRGSRGRAARSRAGRGRGRGRGIGTPGGRQRQERERDPYHIPENTWDAIGKDQEQSRKTIPAKFGDRFNIQKHYTTMKAANWETWTLQESLIQLRLVLPEDHFTAYSKLVLGISLARRHSLSWTEVDAIEGLFFEFCEYYEENIYQYDYNRLAACLPTFHQLQHVAQAI